MLIKKNQMGGQMGGQIDNLTNRQKRFFYYIVAQRKTKSDTVINYLYVL